MNRDPILATKVIQPRRDGSYPRVPLVFRVEGGLHYLRGNKAPYFCLTYTSHRKGFPNQCYSGGAGHETILQHYPRFADLAALHLSDMDGAPTHAEANGWYWLAGALGGVGERYHGGNSKANYGGQYREPTAAECLEVFADYCRIEVAEAELIRGTCNDILAQGTAEGYPEQCKRARQHWADTCESMRPRWKSEAEAAIAHHNLRVFGDAAEWPLVEDATPTPA